MIYSQGAGIYWYIILEQFLLYVQDQFPLSFGKYSFIIAWLQNWNLDRP